MDATTDSVKSKIIAYETFLNEQLKEDLRKILEQRDALYEETAEYLQLKSSIEKIQNEMPPGAELKTKVDLGCNFYAQANVSNPTMICVAIGYGFFLEMTLPEALDFIEKKTVGLQSQTTELTQNACKVKAHIKLVLEGLRELQGISAETKKPHIDVLS